MIPELFNFSYGIQIAPIQSCVSIKNLVRKKEEVRGSTDSIQLDIEKEKKMKKLEDPTDFVY